MQLKTLKIRKYIKHKKLTIKNIPGFNKGIVLTAGGALLTKMDYFLQQATGLPVAVPEDPLTCVVRGTGRCLDEMKTLKNVLIGA